MPSRHFVMKAADAVYALPPAFDGHSSGYTRWAGVDHQTPAVHTGFGIDNLDPGGAVDWHLHSIEESLYILEGELVVETGDGATRLVPGDYGVFPVAQPHALRNLGVVPALWATMFAPQPQPDFQGDTLFPPPPIAVSGPALIDVRDPRTRAFGHVDPAHMDPALQTQDNLPVSASMRTALLVYSGISVKMMVDSDLGAQLSTMFMVQYEPDGFAGVHDHPFEETYFILDGAVDADLDGAFYHLEPGDLAFAGVGSTHAFTNPTDGPVRWLETQAPQPPARHSYRFAREWTYLADTLE